MTCKFHDPHSCCLADALCDGLVRLLPRPSNRHRIRHMPPDIQLFTFGCRLRNDINCSNRTFPMALTVLHVLTAARHPVRPQSIFITLQPRLHHEHPGNATSSVSRVYTDIIELCASILGRLWYLQRVLRLRLASTKVVIADIAVL